MKENLIMLEIERQIVVDREKKVLEQLTPADGFGWSFTQDKLEIARVKLKQVKWRQHGS